MYMISCLKVALKLRRHRYPKMSESIALWWLATMTARGVLVWSRCSQPSTSTRKKSIIMCWTMQASTLQGSARGWWATVAQLAATREPPRVTTTTKQTL